MRWLSLDVGSRRVGLAVCDSEERVVTPLAPIAFGGPASLASAVARIAAERGIEGIVVGVPLTRSGEGRGERRVAAVCEELSGLALPVETVDERGTTAEAETMLRAAGVPTKRWPALVDGLAARLILETYLARRRRETGASS